MKTLLFVMTSLVLLTAFAQSPSFQESLYLYMTQHQAGQMTDKEFNSSVNKLEENPQWTETQDHFLKDYVSGLKPSQQKALALSLEKSVKTNLVSNRPVDDFPEESEYAEKPKTNWVKWGLLAAGAAALLTPYKIVIHTF